MCWLPTLCLKFDCRILINQYSKVGQLEELSKQVTGFADTLPAFKEAFPGRKSYRQQLLVSDLVQRDYMAHNAEEDVAVLAVWVEEKLSAKLLMKHSATLSSARDRFCFLEKSRQAAQEIKARFPRDAISTSMAEKIGRSGLEASHLHLAFQRQGIDGLASLLQEKDNSGNVRVTKSKKVIVALAKYLSAQEANKQEIDMLQNAGPQQKQDHRGEGKEEEREEEEEDKQEEEGEEQDAERDAEVQGDVEDAEEEVVEKDNQKQQQLTPAILAKYLQRKREGYDIPDPTYEEVRL